MKARTSSVLRAILRRGLLETEENHARGGVLKLAYKCSLKAGIATVAYGPLRRAVYYAEDSS